MKTVAYLRVSTAQQDAGSQRLAILEYARRQGFRIDDFIEATASARTNAKHRRLDQLMAVLEPGDRLVVSELSRLGRSLGEVVALLDAIAKASVVFVAVKENIRFESSPPLTPSLSLSRTTRSRDVRKNLVVYLKGPHGSPNELSGQSRMSAGQSLTGPRASTRRMPLLQTARACPSTTELALPFTLSLTWP